MIGAAAELRCYMNTLALGSMAGIPAAFEDRLASLAQAGYSGVQFSEPATVGELAACRSMKMGVAGSGRVNTPYEAEPLAAKLADDGYECATLHVGWGLENDSEAYALLESVILASSRTHLPLYIETHRATICQDMWRTVQFVRRFPDLRFNGDFSHWYAGQEMVYGGFDKKFAFIRPVIDRVRFLHGRIASPGCMQVAIDPSEQPEPAFVAHFRELWTACFHGFLLAEPTGTICFTPELLGPDIYYARTFRGAEESNRWDQSLILKKIAEECFASAQSS